MANKLKIPKPTLPQNKTELIKAMTDVVIPIMYKTFTSFFFQASIPKIKPIKPRRKPAMKIPITPQIVEIIPRVDSFCEFF